MLRSSILKNSSNLYPPVVLTPIVFKYTKIIYIKKVTNITLKIGVLLVAMILLVICFE